MDGSTYRTRGGRRQLLPQDLETSGVSRMSVTPVMGDE
jgi:hypothetical protein